MNGEKSVSAFKFDYYDVFGYLIPGIVLLLGLYAYDNVFRLSGFVDWSKFSLTISKPETVSEPEAGPETKTGSKPTGWDGAIVFTKFLGFLLSAYLAGHIVATFSSIILDKMVSERIQGLPYRRLFRKLRFKGIERHERDLYRTIFGCILVMLLLVSVRCKFDFVAWFIFSLIIIFIIIKASFSFCVRDDIRNPYRYKDPSSPKYKYYQYADSAIRFRPSSILDFFHVKWPQAIKKCKCLKKLFLRLDSWMKIGSLIRGFGFPYIIIEKALLPLLRMCKPFSDGIQDLFLRKFEDIFDINPEKAKTDVYWLTYAFVCEKSPLYTKLIHKWLSLYAFARNVAVSFLLLFIYGVVARLKHGPQGANYAWWCSITAVLAVHFGVRYYYLYYNYYSKFIFRAFLTLTSPGYIALVDNVSEVRNLSANDIKTDSSMGGVNKTS